MKEKYPNWSVYCQDGGQLKTIGGYGKRKKIYSFNEALLVADRYWTTTFRKRVDILILKYTAPYRAKIDYIFPSDS